MKFRTTSLLTSLFAALASMQIASAATLVLNPTDDSTIRLNIANQGASSILFLGDTTVPTPPAADTSLLRSALAFNLNNPVLTAPGVTISSAILTLNVRAVDGSSTNATVTINLHQLSSSFTNDGVTWTSRDGTNDWTTAGGDFGGVLTSIDANSRAVTVNQALDFSSASLTSVAQSSIGGSLNLLAKLSVEDTTQRNLFNLYSSNQTGGASQYIPKLTIEYVPEPSTALLGGLGLLALLRRRRLA